MFGGTKVRGHLLCSSKSFLRRRQYMNEYFVLPFRCSMFSPVGVPCNNCMNGAMDPRRDGSERAKLETHDMTICTRRDPNFKISTGISSELCCVRTTYREFRGFDFLTSTVPKIHPTTDGHIQCPRRPPRWYATTISASAHLLCICILASESSFRASHS